MFIILLEADQRRQGFYFVLGQYASLGLSRVNLHTIANIACTVPLKWGIKVGIKWREWLSMHAGWMHYAWDSRLNNMEEDVHCPGAFRTNLNLNHPSSNINVFSASFQQWFSWLWSTAYSERKGNMFFKFYFNISIIFYSLFTFSNFVVNI